MKTRTKIASSIGKSGLLTALLILTGLTNSIGQTSGSAQSTAAPLKPSQKGYAAVNGLQLYYEIYGAGQPLVLLHGGLGAIEMFSSHLPLLSKNRQVIAVDLQGHGRTADIDRPLNVEFMADDIAALLKHLKISKADIMGFSLGGGVALQTAIRHPETVNRLVVISTPIRRSAFHPDILVQQGQMGPEAAEFLKQTPMYEMYARVAPKPNDWVKLITKIGEAMKVEYDWSDKIKTIKAPTLIIAADADIFRPSHAVEEFELLGGGLKDGGWDGSGQTASQLAIIPGYTHYNIFMAPALAPTALAFLEKPAVQKK